MTFFRVAGEQAHRNVDGKQNVSMPLKPGFRNDFAWPTHKNTAGSKIEEKPSFSPF